MQSSFLKRLFYYIRSSRPKLYWASAASIINKILDLMPPLLVGWIVDTLRGQPPGWIASLTGGKDAWFTAVFISLLGVGIFFFESIFQWLYQLGFLKLAQDVQHNLRTDTYRKLQQREMAFFDDHRLGDTMSMLGDDVNQLERFLNTGFNTFLQLAVLFVFSGIILFSTSWQLALFGLTPIPLIVWGSIYYQKKVSPRYMQVRQAVGNLNARLENNLSGIQVVKSFTAEEFEMRRVDEASDQYRTANYRAISLKAVYVPAIRMAIALGFGGVLLLGSYWVLNDSGILTLGSLVLFSMMIQRLLWPLTALGATFDEYERARASGRRIFSLLDTDSKIQNPVAPLDQADLPERGGHVEFKDVYFAYKNVPVIEGLSFSCRAGQTVGFAGHTGAGKSTIIKLLLRLYDVQQGSVNLDGGDVRQWDIRQLRSNIALVSQDVYLFHGSIFENILYGNPKAGAEQVYRAAAQAHLDQFIEDLPDGYHTLVGERGLKLSGGQRQRLSIARALLKDAPVLILDEATSSVDTRTERDIQSNLNTLTDGKTALVIAHRLSTIRHADIIYVLDKGRVVEQGSHEELLSARGRYWELWNIQTGQLDSDIPIK